MKCFVCNRELIPHNGGLLCKREEGERIGFLTANKAGCGAWYSIKSYAIQCNIEDLKKGF
jgi:hypothetical protein